MKCTGWLVTAIASVISCILLFSGFVMSIGEVTRPPASDWQSLDTGDRKVPLDGGAFSLVALGDSLTRGTGDDSGKGYVGMLKEAFEKRHDRVIVHNFGVQGATLSDLLKQIEEREVKRTIADASVITVSIGGNDLFRGGRSLQNFDPEVLSSIQTAAVQNIDKLFAGIRAVNREAPVVYVGLYNPFPEWQDANLYAKVVHDWNYQVSLKASQYDNVVVVPTFDIIRDPETDLYSDHFHPNGKSYQHIARRILEGLQ